MSAGSRLARDLRLARRFAADLAIENDETLLLTGSATLPFSTAGGDIDLTLITPHESRVEGLGARRSTERLTEQIANGYALCYVPASSGEEIDVEVWPTRRVRAAAAALGPGIRDLAGVEADFTRVGGLDVKVGTDLMHALGWGMPVAGAEVLDRLREAVSWPAYQAFKRDTALVNVRDATKGIPASMRDGRLDEAYLKLCWAADSLVDALIFHSGLSITRWKWRLRYLDSLPAWVGDWYHAVRFEPILDVAWLTEQAEVLRDTWRAHAGSIPGPVQRPSPASAVTQ
ncbi:hypothetical protein [Nonomuraea lactucae]|uniref:hypothetical protein n=1 Tax=Nonomuraea lactucae TaxID=2249762 RepID=UPI000DE2F41A|nr:hypothetical protein [Nonomuraea lactucae]